MPEFNYDPISKDVGYILYEKYIFDERGDRIIKGYVIIDPYGKSVEPEPSNEKEGRTTLENLTKNLKNSPRKRSGMRPS